MSLLKRFTLSVTVLATVASASMADVLVASVNGDRILRFDEVTGAYLGDFVPARTGGSTNRRAWSMVPMATCTCAVTISTPSCALMG